MIVHLAGSLRDYDEDVKTLRIITGIIHDHEATLSHNWVEAAIIRLKNKIKTSDWTPYVQNNMAALQRSDVVIIEASYYKFSQGFQMAAALDHKKPVLVVSREQFKHRYITGFTNSLLTYESYSSEKELAQKVSSFLRKNTIHTKDLRFNFFITRKIARYLDEKSQETGKNRSEIIRDIIKKSNDARKN